MQIQVLFECFQNVLLGRDGEINSSFSQHQCMKLVSIKVDAFNFARTECSSLLSDSLALQPLSNLK